MMFDESRPTSIHEMQEQTEKPDFEDYFQKCYAEISHELREIVEDDSNVLDIGCGKGSAERKLNIMKDGLVITCVDSDPEAIAEMRRIEERFPDNAQYHANGLDIIHEDANEFMKESNLRDQDTILMVAVLHEINDYQRRQEYLAEMFANLSKMNKSGGKVLLADYYFADSVPDEEVERFKAYQLQAIGHADSRHKFVKPEEIIQALEGSDYKVIKQQEMQAVEGIDRFFYMFTLGKAA